MKQVTPLSKGTGKLGATVYAISSGVQIAREYNPNVTNPNTEAQQTTRSKFKLISQLAATMAPVIAIRKDGLKTARNQFQSINYDKARFSEGQADVNLNVIQLTKSNKSFAGFNADRSGGTAIAVKLNANSAADLSRVVYIMYEKQADGTLRLVDSLTVSTPGADGLFQGSLAMNSNAVVCYAYGIKDVESGISAKFGNLYCPSAEDVARLLVSSSDNMGSVQLTKTAGLTMAAGVDTADSDDVEHFTVSVVTSGNGSAIGGGRFEAGQLCTLRATPDAEATFVAWKANNASGAVLSTDPIYSFEVQANVTICAVFQGGPTPHYNISATPNPAAGGSVSGAGSYEEGAQCTLIATPNDGYRFAGWYEGSTQVSANATLSFTVAMNRILEARFEESTAVVITLTSDHPNVTTQTGAGEYERGQQVTINSTTTDSNLEFDGWYNGSTKVSQQQQYTFTAQSSMTLQASWEELT